MSTIVWFHSDLRLEDNTALAEAISLKEPIYPVFIWSPEEEKPWALGGASKWWLHHALEDLKTALDEKELKLIIRSGEAKVELEKLIQETRASTVYWNRRYWPNLIDRDKKIEATLVTSGTSVKTFNSSLLHEPISIKNKSGKPFQVFTPFWKHCLTLDVEEPVLPNWRVLVVPTKHPKSKSLKDLNLLPKIKWDKEFYNEWDPTLIGAKKALTSFVKSSITDYKTERDFPSKPATSRLSPYLRCGQIGPRQIWKATKTCPNSRTKGAVHFLSEVGWREFAYHLIYHFPKTPKQPLRSDFNKFPWKKNQKHLNAWQKGLTGFPIIDAGMRELWQTGWMHNRVRMIVGSLLVKNLLHSWEEGAAWFWDTLVDADLASNTLGWQWVGGCGADAAPYFRIFNPILQGEKFDPEGIYVKKYIPELKNIPIKYIHKPWEAEPLLLLEWGIQLGRDYPMPIIDLKTSRDAALEAYNVIKRGK